MRLLANHRSIFKRRRIRIHVVVWDREDYVAETEKYKNVYSFKSGLLQGLAGASNYIFKSFKRKGEIKEKEIK